MRTEPLRFVCVFVGLALGGLGCTADSGECTYDTDCTGFCEKCDPQSHRCVDDPDCEQLQQGECRTDYDCDPIYEYCHKDDDEEIGECRLRSQGDEDIVTDGDTDTRPDHPDADCSAPGLPGQGIDRDDDSWGEYCDCDDANPRVYPGRAEQIWNCLDDDCDPSTKDDDLDDDGYGNQFRLCDPGPDCDDRDQTVYPGAPEICDGKDNDCDGPVDEDDVCEPFDGGLPDGGEVTDAPVCPDLSGSYYVDAACFLIEDGEVMLTQVDCRVTLSIDAIPCSGVLDADMNIIITCVGLEFNCQGRASLSNSFVLNCSPECSFTFNYLGDEVECLYHDQPECMVEQKVCSVVGEQGTPVQRCINKNNAGRQPGFFCDEHMGINCVNWLCQDGACGAVCQGDHHCLGFPGTSCQTVQYDDGMGTTGDIQSCTPVHPGETRCSRTPECAPGRVCRPRPEQDRVITTCQEPPGSGLTGSSCSQDPDCRSGLCLEGLCSEICWDDSDCRHDFRCQMTTIQDLSGALRPIQACLHDSGSCTSDNDCPPAKCCWLSPSLVEDRLEAMCYYGNEIPAGQSCTGDIDCCTICYDYPGYCLGACATDDDCPTFTGGACSQDGDCDPGTLCEAGQCTRAFSCRNQRFVLRLDHSGNPIIDTARICMPDRRPCLVDQDCLAGESCKLYFDIEAGQIEPKCEVSGPGDGPLGGLCNQNGPDDCLSGLCLREEAGAMYCSQMCQRDEDCGGYGSGYYCAGVPFQVRNGLMDHVPVCIRDRRRSRTDSRRPRFQIHRGSTARTAPADNRGARRRRTPDSRRHR